MASIIDSFLYADDALLRWPNSFFRRWPMLDPVMEAVPGTTLLKFGPIAVTIVQLWFKPDKNLLASQPHSIVAMVGYARPHFADPILTLSTCSFPSGHVAVSTVFHGLGVVWVSGQTRVAHWRVPAVVAAMVAIVLGAFSRMYLGVRYLSEVGATFVQGVARRAHCLGALAAFWRKAGAGPDGRFADQRPKSRDSQR